MKILLVAVNAKYIHSNLAVYSLRAYANKYAGDIKIVEMTINHPEEEILKAIYREKAGVVAFSCYIWNIGIIRRVAAELRKLEPKIKIWFGGPEVTYDAHRCLTSNKFLDGIMLGEGEQTFLELAGFYLEGPGSLEDIAGLAFRESAGDFSISIPAPKAEEQIHMTSQRKPLILDTIPFPYEDMEVFQNRIIYYESSRGCPFSCSYCLSSIDRGVRLRSAVLVKQELKKLLDYKVPQVKFVDRTFNCNKKHAMEIWSFIKENDNGITNFHFEISAELLTEEELELLSSLRPGLIQLEIGVQSTNQDTLRAIHRSMDLDRLKDNVEKIRAGRNINQHLDLIAGLPLEDEVSFEKSFGEVYAMKPDQLQLGFLKVLKGSPIEQESSSYGIVFRDEPPYEVLYTEYIDYDALLRLKGICEMVELYYNSAQFTASLRYLEGYYDSSMRLYRELYEYYEKKGLSLMSHSRMRRYEILLDFFEELLSLPGRKKEPEAFSLFKELLVFDLFTREDIKARPPFSPVNPLQGRGQELYRRFGLDRGTIHLEQFQYDIMTFVNQGKVVKKENILLFDYSRRDPRSRAAAVSVLEGQPDCCYSPGCK